MAPAQAASRRGQLTYNLRSVVRATGLTPDTLRAWERRYGVPKPQRTPGGHRIYSQSDVDMLKWLVARQAEGLSISRAVDQWQQLTAQGIDPLARERPPELAGTLTASRIDDLRGEWVRACLGFHEQQAEAMLGQAFALYPPETVCLQILQGGLATIGTAWQKGEASVQQEHFASELAMRRVERLIGAAPAPIRPGRILACCPPEEEHTFAPLLLTLLLRWRSWDVVFLGANVPLDRLAATTTAIAPDLAVLSAQQLYTASTLLAAVGVLNKAGVVTAYGGRIFNLAPGLRAKVPAAFLGANLHVAAGRVEELMQNPGPPTAGEPLAERFVQALAHYCERLPQLEAQAAGELAATPIPASDLGEINAHLARSILASLTFGDMALLDLDVDWVGQMLTERNAPPTALPTYLAAYQRAVREQLDERGQPIVEHLGQLVEDAVQVEVRTHDQGT
ncbi:MAG: MerR family transcriptional regulator [Chloroflexota bacterium]